MEVRQTVVLAVLLTVGLFRVQAEELKLCVDEITYGNCSKLQEASKNQIKCIQTPDKIHCMRKIQNGEADLVRLEPQEIYTAGAFYDLQPVASEQLGNHLNYRYRAVAVIKKSSGIKTLNDLKGKKSCHTAFRRTAGWRIPVGILLNHFTDLSCENEINAISSLFSESCVPGKWSVDKEVDNALRMENKNLCNLCNKTCDENDPYLGYDGALKCLSDKSADVAFTTAEATEKFFKDGNDKFEFLCINGSTNPLNNPCIWANRPTNAYMAKKGTNVDQQVKLLIDHFNSVKNKSRFSVLFGESTGIVEISTTYENYLGNYIMAINRTLKCEKKQTAKFCVSSELEEEKCKDFSNAAYGQYMRPKIECVKKNSLSECIKAVSKQDADLITLDGGDVYNAGKYDKMLPIVAEQYSSDDAINGSYYAVAVIRANASNIIKNFKDLKGKRSCHTGISRTAGWIVPVGELLTHDLINKKECDREVEVSKFFSASCVPGANQKHENLCKLCIGNQKGQHKCEKNSEELYSGYGGAFRCLVEKGDVAFVKHTTVKDYIAKGLEWTKNLKSDDFKLLCGSGGVDSIENYKKCNLAFVPPHFTMTSEKSDYQTRVNMVDMLTSAGRKFDASSKVFRLFRSYSDKHDLLFKDSTVYLKSVPFNSTYDAVLGKNYLDILIKVDPNECDSAYSITSTLNVVFSALFMSLLSSRWI